MTFKSTTVRLARLFEKSRDGWKQKALDRQKQIRSLEIKVRDLEKSRERWKTRALGQSTSTAAPEDDSENTVTHEAKKMEEDAEPPRCHHYSLQMISLSIQLQLLQISLRGSSQVLSLFDWALGTSSPCFPTVQNWACRYGLYLLMQVPEYREDWVFVVDHTLGQGKNKCLVILGISESDLERVNYCPGHGDMQVLLIEVTDLGTGEVLSASLEQLSRKVGVPTQIVADAGSDVRKGILLYQECHPGVIYTYDISHRMATFLKQELSGDERWTEYLAECSQAIPRHRQTDLAFLCPPRQRTKARFMQTHHQIRWGRNMLRYYDRGDFSLIGGCFMLTWALWEELRHRFGDPLAYPSSPLVGKRYLDEASFQQALAGYLGDHVNNLPRSFWETADKGRQRFLEGFGWLLNYRQDLHQYETLLEWSHSLQKILKNQGLSANTRDEIQEQLKQTHLQIPRIQTLGQQIQDHLQQEVAALPDGKVVLASSDIIESVFGTYKAYTERGPLKEIGKLVLMIPVCVAGVCRKRVKEAMETVRSVDVKQWLGDNCGPSMMAKRRQAFNPKKTKKVHELCGGVGAQI